jgi:hypothetical protein
MNEKKLMILEATDKYFCIAKRAMEKYFLEASDVRSFFAILQFDFWEVQYC